MKYITLHLSKRDADLLGLLNDIGTRNFRKIIRMSLRTLTDPSEYNDKALKKILSQRGKYKITPPQDIRLAFCETKDPDLIKLLNSLKSDVSAGYFVKVAIRNFLGAYLYKYFFKGSPEFFDLDKRVIPILRNAKIKTQVRVIKEKADTIKSTIQTEPVKPKPVFNEPLPIESEKPLTFEDNNTSNNDDDFDALSMLEQLLD